MQLLRRLVAVFLLAALLTGSVFAGTAAVVSPPVTQGDGLRVVYHEAEIDMVQSTVTCATLYYNAGSTPLTAQTALPTGELAPSQSEITAQLDGSDVPLTNGVLTHTVPAEGYQTVRFSYHTAEALSGARLLSYDFSSLDHGTNIGKLSVTVHFDERDIPLIQSVFPPNYTYHDSSINVTLYDFAVTSLLHRVLLERETLRDLRYGREYEPTKYQAPLLANYETWYRDGLPFDEMALVSTNVSDLFLQACGLAVGAEEYELDRYYTSIDFYGWDNSRAALFGRMFQYLVLRMRLRLGLSAELDRFTMNDCSLLQDYCDEQAGTAEEKQICVVEFASNPSLQGQPLYVGRTEEYGGETSWEKVSELQILQTDITGTHKDLSRRYSLVKLMPEQTDDPEAVAALANALNASLYVRQMLYDNRDGSLPKTHTEWGDYYPKSPIGYCGEENRPLAQVYWQGPYTSDDDPPEFLIDFTGDPVLSRLNMPAFVQYRGIVEADGHVVFMEDGHYQSHYRSLSSLDALQATERGRTLFAQTQSARRSAAERVNTEIREHFEKAPTKPEEPATQPSSVLTPVVEEKKTAPTPTLLYISLIAGLSALVLAIIIFIKTRRKPS